MNPRRKAVRNVVLFAVVVLAAGWLGRILDDASGAEDGAGIGQLVWIISPIATAVVLRSWGGDGWGGAGLRPRFRGNGRWYAVSMLFYPVILAITAGVGLQLDEFVVDGGGGFPVGAFATAFFVSLVPVLVTSIAEEFGWRGYLVPRLDAIGLRRWANHLVVGLIWGAWHIPYVAVFWDFTDESLATLVPRLLVGTLLAAVIYGEIRMATGSVWPAVLMHGMGNAFVGALLADEVLEVDSSTPVVFGPGADGLVVIAATALGAWAVVVAVRRQNHDRESAVSHRPEIKGAAPRYRR
ncbi:MAG: CPBP family intramembrane metalloprotease [Acidimicrobiia bacterium]|nr:CPBP family intramembrane metalloprotease [Acidimicrobiia bacterium]